MSLRALLRSNLNSSFLVTITGRVAFLKIIAFLSILLYSSAACTLPGIGTASSPTATAEHAPLTLTVLPAAATSHLESPSRPEILTAVSETPSPPGSTARPLNSPILFTALQSTSTSTPLLLSTPAPNRTQYSLNVVLDYAGHTLDVEQHITYVNTTPGSLAALPLVVEARRYPGAFQLLSVTDSRGARFSDFQWKDTLLTLALPAELAPGDAARFTLAYSLRLPGLDTLANTRPHPLGYNSQQVIFGDWYPSVPPFVPGKGWLAHPPAMYGEHLVYEIADFEVAIRFTDGQSNLVIAASAPAVQDGEWLRFSHTAARSFAWSASSYYQVASQEVQLAEGQVVEVSSYFFAYHENAGRALLDGMTQALVLYSNLFGAYPHPALAGVQVGFMDGMEYDGLFFLSTDFYNWFKDPPADFLVALAAHEVAHQWWSGLVGSDQALQPWLDEALCTYSEHIYYENLYPEALEWWWEYRVNYYQPAGWVDISVYDVPQEFGYYRKYRDPVYLRGALFLDELRQLLGDSTFFASLRQYVARYTYQQASAGGFVDILRQNTPADLSPILTKYFKNLK